LGDFVDSPYEDRLLMAKNKAHMQAIKDDITREQEDRKTLEKGGTSAVMARMAAGILSPEILMPAGSIMRSAQGGVSLLKSAASASLWTGGSVAVSEMALQASQQTREKTESVKNIAYGTVLGGLIGTAAAKLSKSQFDDLAVRLQKDLTLGDQSINKTFSDLSAAATPKMTLDDLALKGKQTQVAANMTRLVIPFNRIMTAPFTKGREIFLKMNESALVTNLNSEGKTLGVAAETEIKLYEQGVARAYQAINNNFKAVKKTEKQAGRKPMTHMEFRERVSRAMRNGDADVEGVAEITKAAQEIRSAVFEPLKKQAIELKLLPEDVEAKFADTYLTRVWNKQKLIAYKPEAMDMLRNWARDKVAIVANELREKLRLSEIELKAGKAIEANKKFIQEVQENLRLVDNGSDDYINEVAEEMYSKLSGIGMGEKPDFIAPITRGPLKEKLLDIPDNVAEKFLENDIGAIVNTYTRQMGSQVAFVRKFGNADLKDQLQELDDEFKEMLSNAKTEKDRVTLGKEYKEVRRLLEEQRDIMRGTYQRVKNPDGLLMHAATAISDLQYMAKLGGVVVSSIADASRVVMVHGMQQAFGDLLQKLTLPKELSKLQLEDLRQLGFDFETVLASRMSTLADVSDPFVRGSKLTKLTGHMASGFSKLTLINHWNDMMKNFAAVTTQNRVFKNLNDFVSGKVSPKENEYMSYLGIDNATAKTLQEQFKKHGIKKGRAYIANLKEWDATPQVESAIRVFNGALRKEADIIIVTKGVADVPSFMNHPAGKLAMQFKSFILAANQRVLMRGLQQADAAAASGFIMAIAMGMMVSAIKKAEREVSSELNGRPVKEQDIADWTASKWLVEGIDRSGILSLVWEANNIWEKGGGYGLTQMIGQPPASRFASRNIGGALFGPTLGTALDATSIIGTASAPLTGMDVTESDIHAIRQLVPFQNLIGVKHVFDALEGQANNLVKN
jgi:hypothetical protein